MKCKEPAAHRLFGVSLLYMTALFAALIVEKLIGLPALGAVVVRDDDAGRARRRKRNIALGLALGGVVILVLPDVDRAMARTFRPLEGLSL